MKRAADLEAKTAAARTSQKRSALSLLFRFENCTARWYQDWVADLHQERSAGSPTKYENRRLNSCGARMQEISMAPRGLQR